MSEATIEVRERDAAMFRDRMRLERAEARRHYEREAADPAAHPDDVAMYRRHLAAADWAAPFALDTDRTTFTADPGFLLGVAQRVMRDAIDELAEVARYGPPAYSRIGELAERVQYWSAEAKRLNLTYLESVGVTEEAEAV